MSIKNFERKTIDWHLPKESLDYPIHNISEYEDGFKINVNAIFITHSNYGDRGLIVDLENKLRFSLPKHLTELCRSIIADSDAVDEIKENKVIAVIRECFNSVYNTNYNSVDFILK